MTITIRKVTGTVNALGDIDIQLLEGYRVYQRGKIFDVYPTITLPVI